MYFCGELQHLDKHAELLKEGDYTMEAKRKKPGKWERFP